MYPHTEKSAVMHKIGWGGMKRDVIDHIQPRDQSPGGGTTGLSGENQIS